MLGMGPLIWQKITSQIVGQISPAPGLRRPEGRKDTRYYSGRYYRAIDTVTRGERKVCSCDLAIPRHALNGRMLKAFP
jgi:hypothetical protein